MKKYPVYAFTAALLAIMMDGCQVIGAIFKAGVWTGIILVVIIILIVIFIIARSRK